MIEKQSNILMLKRAIVEISRDPHRELSHRDVLFDISQGIFIQKSEESGTIEKQLLI